ncbi:MAG: hypothetical protein KC912_19790 [Proteobacteria bacterium]|nr:hypothetical protein [Pseudomonadota bacterium]
MIRTLPAVLLLAACGGTSTVAELHEDAAMRGRTLELYSTTPDQRRCVSPLCGGDWVTEINAESTRCKDGGPSDVCYVADMDLAGTASPSADGAGLIVAGRLGARRFGSFGKLGTFKASGDVWVAVDDGFYQGTVHGASDNGIRCITTPCFSTDLITVGHGNTQAVAGLDLSALDLDTVENEAVWQAYSEGTLFVAGVIRLDPNGSVLVADEAWVPAK